MTTSSRALLGDARPTDERLTAIARAVLARPAAEITDWWVEPVPYVPGTPSTGALLRVCGQAADSGRAEETLAWSVFLKVLQSPTRWADLAVIPAEELERRLADGEWVVDVRNRVAFAADHLAGSVSFEYGDGESFTSILGWVRPWGERLTLVGSRADVEAAIGDLARIGIDTPAVALGADPHGIAPEAPLQRYPRVGWADLLAGRQPGDVLLDVRRPDEYAVSHLEGAVHVPVYEVLPRVGTIPPGRLWVYCASGYRAGVAARLLQRSGRDVVHIDDEYDSTAAAGVTVVTP